ncbi:MAG: HtaA domain-containing protein [Actinomycetota bacterium]
MRRALTALLVAVLLAITAGPTVVTAAPLPCTVTGGTLDWGVKQDFRDYITGPVAAGSWIENGGATFLTDQFRWQSASGTMTPSAGTGLVGFIGSVTFSGHAGTVTRRFANPELQFVRPSLAYLLLDVSGVKQDGTPVYSQGVQFVSLVLPAGALDTNSRTLEVDSVPATLTGQGAAVFGRYAAGDSFDPVSFTLRFASACSTATTVTTASPAPSGPVPLGALTWLVLALGVVAILVLVVLVLSRRRAS